MQIKPFWLIYKVSLKFGFNMKSVFITALICCLDFQKNLEIELKQIGNVLQNNKRKTEKKFKRKRKNG
jgi:hypothetical protein